MVAGGRPQVQGRAGAARAGPTPTNPLTLTLHSLSNTERDSVSSYLSSSYPSGVRVLSTLPKGLQSSGNHVFGTIAADAVGLTSSYRDIRSKTFAISVRVTDDKQRTITKSFNWTIRDQYIPIAYVGRYGDGKDGAPNISDLYSLGTYGNPNVGVCTTQAQYDSYGGAIWHQSLPKDAPFEWGRRTGSLRIYYLANPADDAGCVSGVPRVTADRRPARRVDAVGGQALERGSHPRPARCSASTRAVAGRSAAFAAMAHPISGGGGRVEVRRQWSAAARTPGAARASHRPRAARRTGPVPLSARCKRRAEGEDVGGPRRRRALDQRRVGVLDRRHRAHAGDRHARREHLTQPEVGQLAAAVVQQHVLRLDVAVHDARVVQRVGGPGGVGHGGDHGRPIVPRRRPANPSGRYSIA